MSNGNPDHPSLEEQVRLLTQQLQQAQKLTALGELVSTTTHEFNNVLMTVINYAKMGLRCRDDATRDKALEKILAAGEKAARITNSILGVARNRSEGFEPTDLSTLVDDALVLLEREMNKYRITVERQLEAVPEALVNANQIQQILLNLLINARQAMPRGGRIIIKLEHDPADDTVVLSVRDTGSGIAPDKLRRIFDPFFSTKDGPDETGKGGTGLGLSSCRSIVESHRGRIRVQSTLGKGTAFTIKLPTARKDRASAGNAARQITPTALPAQNGPAQNGPAQNGPAQNGPAQNGPTQNGPTQSGPTQSGPTKTTPLPPGALRPLPPLNAPSDPQSTS